jgi:hypothetical protein
MEGKLLSFLRFCFMALCNLGRFLILPTVMDFQFNTMNGDFKVP